MSLPSPSTGVIARNISVDFTFEGFSRLVDPPKGYEYLKNVRRIKYGCNITMQIGYDFPFIVGEQFRDSVKEAAQSSMDFLGELKTCGIIAEYLLDVVLDKHPETPKVSVTVKELENDVGETVEYVSSTIDEKLAYISSVRTWNRTIGAHILIQKANRIKQSL